MKKRSLMMLALLAAAATKASAMQANFDFAPPPIPSPEFKAKGTDYKLTGTYISISGKGIHLSGGGGDISFRKAVTDRLAWDFQLGGMALPGTIDLKGVGRVDVRLVSLGASTDIECLFIPKRGVSLIGFVGLRVPYTSMSGRVNYEGTEYKGEVSVVMVGIPFGMQAGLSAGRSWTVTLRDSPSLHRRFCDGEDPGG